jgi:hypothetical protein
MVRASADPALKCIFGRLTLDFEGQVSMASIPTHSPRSYSSRALEVEIDLGICYQIKILCQIKDPGADRSMREGAVRIASPP